MAQTSDQIDLSSFNWYFGHIPRAEADEILSQETHDGVFLIRDSTTKTSAFVLCVREMGKISHYIIDTVSEGNSTKYRLGEKSFDNLPQLIEFYKYHYLDTSSLTEAVSRRTEDVIANHDFTGKDPEDLPFQKGERLTIVFKQEAEWWTARNSRGQIGSIPVPYVERLFSL